MDLSAFLTPLSSRLQFVSALLTLHELLKSVQHLRLTGKQWPKRDKDDIPSSSNSDRSTLVGPIELDPIVDLSLFPNVSILEIEAVPPEAIRNFSTVFPKLRLLKFEVRMGIKAKYDNHKH
jgi:hypothetical protein